MAIKGSTEIKVGIFVFIGLLALFYLTFELAEEAFTPKDSYHIYAVFENVSGLTKGANIEMAGVKIGRVGNIGLTPDGKAKVELLIYKQYKIPEDAEAVIKTYGVLGDKFVEIKAGRSKNYLKPGAVMVKTYSPASLEDILAKIEPALEGLNEIFGTKEGKTNFKEFIANIKETSENFKKITTDIKKGKGTLGKLLIDEGLYNELVVVVENLKMFTKEMAEGQKVITELVKNKNLSRDIIQTVANLRKISEELEKGEGTLGKLMKDDSLYKELKAIAINLKDLTDRIKKGEGTLGKLVYDDKMYKDLEAIATTLKKLTDKIEKGEGTLGKLLKDESLYIEAKKTLQSVNRAAQVVEEQTPISVLGTVAGAVMK
jgi:phospholipid/cholesterol/gamma-HCH transport system substrate-binding protein